MRAVIVNSGHWESMCVCVWGGGGGGGGLSKSPSFFSGIFVIVENVEIKQEPYPLRITFPNNSPPLFKPPGSATECHNEKASQRDTQKKVRPNYIKVSTDPIYIYIYIYVSIIISLILCHSLH